MAAMVWPLMCRIFRMTMKLLLWIVRILERWLKRFDDKTVSFKEDPYLVPIEKVIEPVNLPDENRIQENVTRISIPREPVNTNTQTPDPARVVYNCPLCDCPMLYKKGKPWWCILWMLQLSGLRRNSQLGKQKTWTRW